MLLFAGVRRYTEKGLFPPEAWILLLGLGYGVSRRMLELDWLPDIQLDPVTTLFLVLPLLIFGSGLKIRPDALKIMAMPIGFFAVVGVIASAFLIAWPIATVLGIPLADAMVLGIALGATDPAAVGAIFQKIRMPERLEMLVEGESLFNDGVTVVLFAFVTALVVTGDTGLNFTAVFGDFAWSVLAAIPTGMAAGCALAKIQNVWCGPDNGFPTTTLSLVLAYGVFVIAEELLHVSGVIAVLLSAIVFARQLRCGGKTLADTDDAELVGTFWAYLGQTLNAFLFFVLGAVTGGHDFTGLPLSAVGVALFVIVVSRIVMIYGGSFVLRIAGWRMPVSWQNVLILGGVRGGISAALILMIPVDYEHYQVFLCLAYVMIVFTLFLQPPLMKLYLKKSDIDPGGNVGFTS